MRRRDGARAAGHGSGGSLALRYLTWPDRDRTVDGVVVLAPFIGDMIRDHSRGILRTKRRLMWLYRASGRLACRHCVAVDMASRSELIVGAEQLVRASTPLQLTTVLVDAAIVTSARTVFQRLAMPLLLLVGSRDEAFRAEDIAAAASRANVYPRRIVIVPDETHLSVLRVAYDYIVSFVGAVRP